MPGNEPFRLAFDPAAVQQLERLDSRLAHRILAKVEWLAGHADQFPHEALRGAPSSRFKLRVGAYRVIYSLQRDMRLIVVHLVGHRREIYKRM